MSNYILAIALIFSALQADLLAQGLVRVPGKVTTVKDQITSVPMDTVVSDFLVGATEVTQREYEAVTGSSPSFYKGGDRPVENVTWWDAIRYCNQRSVKENLTACYNLATGERAQSCTGYRLPTEAEWTIAAGPMPPADQLTQTANLGVTSTKSMDVFRGPLTEGTAKVRSRQPNALGLYDLRGNVWEWCEDYFDVVATPAAVRNPSGPASGLDRVIRGGSFISTTSRWSRDYRSSMSPNLHSRFTGFRVVRSMEAQGPHPSEGAAFFQPYNQPPKGFESATGNLTELVPPGASAATWPGTAASIRARWESLLAEPKPSSTSVSSRVVRKVDQRNFHGQITELEVEPGIWEKIYVLRPKSGSPGPAPVLIVPFYDIDTPAAADLSGRNYTRGVNTFAYTAAQHGYIAVAVRWYGESYGESYSEAVANLAIRHPGATGLGKWIADARRVVDFIQRLPDADPTRIGIMGHSLGGKMALYAAAFEPRIRAVVVSEPGIGFKFSNYEDYWYLGDKLATAPPGTDQHELIALLAPRPFLLIGGDEFDKSESWHYINAGRHVYSLLGKPDNIGYFNHHTGHTPSPDAVAASFRWLDHFLLP